MGGDVGDFGILGEGRERIFDWAVVDGLLFVSVPEDDAGVGSGGLVEGEGLFSGADELLFGGFSMAPTAVAEVFFGDGRRDGNHNKEMVVAVFGKKAEENGFDGGVEEGDVENNVVALAGEFLYGKEHHDGAEFVGFGADVGFAIEVRDFLVMRVVGREATGGDEDGIDSLLLTVGLDGGEKLGGFAGAGKTGDADEVVARGFIFGEIGEDPLQNGGVFV